MPQSTLISYDYDKLYCHGRAERLRANDRSVIEMASTPRQRLSHSRVSVASDQKETRSTIVPYQLAHHIVMSPLCTLLMGDDRQPLGRRHRSVTAQAWKRQAGGGRNFLRGFSELTRKARHRTGRGLGPLSRRGHRDVLHSLVAVPPRLPDNPETPSAVHITLVYGIGGEMIPRTAQDLPIEHCTGFLARLACAGLANHSKSLR